MATNHRIFTGFAVEDKWARDYLIGQGKNERTPFEFVDMSVKEPWDEQWKVKCRTRIKGCDGMIALVSKNTEKASGALWEIKCAKEERVPILGIYTSSDDRPLWLPAELSGISVKGWTWSNIKAFLDGL